MVVLRPANEPLFTRPEPSAASLRRACRIKPAAGPPK